MTIEERLDANDRQIEGLISLAGTHDEQIAALIKLTGSHDHEIAALTKLAATQSETAKALATVAEHNITAIEAAHHEIDALRATVADLTRQWQAYINTLPRH